MIKIFLKISALLLVLATNIAHAQIINSVAGNGNSSYSGDGGDATLATFFNPASLAFDKTGNLFIGDLSNNCIRKINKNTNIITTAAGTLGTNYPVGIAVDSIGNIYVAQMVANVVRKITPSGVSSIFAGTGVGSFSGDGGAATSATLNLPYDVEIDPKGKNLYIADASNHRIRKVNLTTGIISTVAGTGTYGYNGDNISALNAQLASPSTLAFDRLGNLFILDKDNARIRKVSASSEIITTIMGTGTSGYTGDGGLATAATMSWQCYGLIVDSVGNVYFSDIDHACVRKITVGNGIINTIAGTGVAGYFGDGGLAINAKLNTPRGLLVDKMGNIFFADQANNRIRKISLGVLPVKFIQLTGKSFKDYNLISWKASFESNCAGFEIESSLDGILFNKAGAVANTNPVNHVKDYSFKANTANKGITFYRIKEVDLDGHFFYSKIISVSTSSELNTLCNIYPNPFRDKVQIDVRDRAHSGNCSLVICDAKGAILLSQYLPGSFKTIDLSKFSSGIYCIKLSFDNETVTKTLIKE